jgi:hypothetical protein
LIRDRDIIIWSWFDEIQIWNHHCQGTVSMQRDTSTQAARYFMSIWSIWFHKVNMVYQYGSIWLNMAQYGLQLLVHIVRVIFRIHPYWSILIHIDPYWSILTILSHIEPYWGDSKVGIGARAPIPTFQYGSIRSIWLNMAQYGSIWINMA